MIRTIEIIYNRLHVTSGKNSSCDVESQQALRFLAEKQNIDPTNELYINLFREISSLREKYLPIGFIERFCLANISAYVLAKYPVNIAEAYLLSYVALNKPVDLNMMYFKLGTSGLIGATKINGTVIGDTEAIAQFIIKSLEDAELIKITENRYIIFGKNFSIDL